MIKFTIPGQARTPQTGQKIVRRGKASFLFPGKLYRDYKTLALWVIKSLRFSPKIELPFDSLIRVTPNWYHKDRRIRDEDNLKKGLGDILKSSRLIVDDRLIRWGESGHFMDKLEPRCEITIEQISLNE